MNEIVKINASDLKINASDYGIESSKAKENGK